jgi:hypothetical protein
MAGSSEQDDRLFVRDGWRHYRRRYSLAEVRWGLACLGALLLIGGWVAWKGAHPDPALFADGAALLKSGRPTDLPVTGPVTPPTASAAHPTPAAPAMAPAEPAAAAGRGPLPTSLAGAGWREEKIAQFDPENLYVKIDGRADFFKGFGFRRLWSVLLVSEHDAATTVDVEMYDLGRPDNALGVYGAERAPDARPKVEERGLWHLARNALYMARGPYYLRVIGSDESPAMTAKLSALADALNAAIAGQPLPWAYGIFVGAMGLDPGRVTYFPENAFSFSFARDVWAARPRGKNDDLELFIAARTTPAEARTLAAALRRGFGQFGEPAGKLDGAPVLKDQFLGALTVVVPHERWVLGVRGAATREMLQTELGRLSKSLADAPASLKDRARPAAANESAADAVGKGARSDEH